MKEVALLKFYLINVAQPTQLWSRFDPVFGPLGTFFVLYLSLLVLYCPFLVLSVHFWGPFLSLLVLGGPFLVHPFWTFGSMLQFILDLFVTFQFAR